ncbi:MAG: hypothetical protein A2X80_14755 [Geobacteraceae bacterium GWB2_52_12]|nr:MAG: hypothetical protein A2X80_14755 [Geobacteraceae bacterium GWB2_52_12]
MVPFRYLSLRHCGDAKIIIARIVVPRKATGKSFLIRIWRGTASILTSDMGDVRFIPALAAPPFLQQGRCLIFRSFISSAF